MTARIILMQHTIDEFGHGNTIVDALYAFSGGDAMNHYDRLKSWRFKWNRRAVARWGMCHTGKREIELNAVLVDHPIDRDITFLHEVAHAIEFLVFGYTTGHGPRWQRIMRLLGQEPKAPHTAEAVAAAHELYVSRASRTWQCKRCGHKHPVTARRRKPAHHFVHRGCGGRFTEA